MSSIFRYQNFVANSGSFKWKVPLVDNFLSSHEKEIDPNTSLDENCIEFDFQMDLNYYVVSRQMYFALKQKLVTHRSYETYNTKEIKKVHKKDAKAHEEATAEEDEEAPVLVGTLVNNILHSVFFPVLKRTSTDSKFTIHGTVWTKVSQFQKLHGSLVWIRGSFALPGVRL